MTDIHIPMRARFIPHDGWSKDMTTLDKFAACLAEGCTLEESARRAGYSGGSAHMLKQRLCDKLGSQAI